MRGEIITLALLASLALCLGQQEDQLVEEFQVDQEVPEDHEDQEDHEDHEDQKETSRVCTFPSVACYDGSVRLSEQGNRYHSFQGIRWANISQWRPLIGPDPPDTEL